MTDMPTDRETAEEMARVAEDRDVAYRLHQAELEDLEAELQLAWSIE